MQGGWVQLLTILAVLAAPALSWIWGRLRENYELKKARDEARRRQEDALRTTHIVERREVPTPEAERQTQRQDLAARRQAQLRELRERQYQRQQGAGEVARGPSTQIPGPPPPAQQRPPAGPLRPNAPVPGGRRPPIAQPSPARPIPTRPVARAGQRPPTRRPPVGAPSIRPRPDVSAPPAPDVRGPIAATQIGSGRAEEALRRRTGSGIESVRGMLMRPDGRPRPRADLARAIALTEVLAPPLASRADHELPWNRVP